MSWALEPTLNGAVKPFGRTVDRSKSSGRPDLAPLSVYLGAGVVPRDSRDDNHNRLGADLANYLAVEPGDIVFNKLRTWQGGLGVSMFHGIVSPAYFVCRPLPQMEPRFLHYLLRSAPYLAEFTRISKFMPPSQFDILWEDLKKVPIPVVAIRTQRAIAGFLDAETARIDALVTKKRRLIELLEERVDNEILRTIGRSQLAGELDIRAAPIRRLLYKHERWKDSGEMITAFRDGEVLARAARRQGGFTDSWTAGSRVQLVEAGDIVVHGLDGFSGAIGDSQHSGVCSPVYHVCSPFEGDSAFYGRLLRLLAVSGYLGNFATSTRERAVDFRNWDLFGRIPVPVLPQADQIRIGQMIRRLRPLRQRIQTTERLAQERRQALITAAVTGQIEVPGAAA